MFGLELAPQEVLLAFCIVMFGALSQGVAGFGLALLIGPLLVMVDPMFLPGPVVLLVSLVCALMVFKERSAVNVTNVKRTLVGYLLGTGLAAALLTSLPARETALLLGGLILVAVGISAAGLSVPPNRRVLFSAGIIGGFMGTVSGVGLPPLALALQNEPGPRLRGTLACVGLLSIIMAEIALVSIGKIGRDEVLLACILAPAVVIGFLLSTLITRHIDSRFTRPLIFLLSGISAVTSIIKHF